MNSNNNHFLKAIVLVAALTTPMGVARATDGPAFDMERLKPWGEIESLAWPLMVAAASQCKDPSYRVGFEVLGTTAQGLFVRSVSADSPASGKLEIGDRVVAVNGHRFKPDGADAYGEWSSSMRDEFAESDEIQRWTMLRDGVEATFDLAPVPVCHVDIFYVGGSSPSFLRREGMLIFTPQLFEIAPEPWMVQAQIAHDLGHRLGQHEQKATRTTRWTSIAGNVIGALGGPNLGGAGGHALNIRRRPQQEVDADRAGIDLAVGLGINERELIQYWVDVIELESSSGTGASWLSAHPAHESRIDALQERFNTLVNASTPAEAPVDADPTGLMPDTDS